MRDPGTVYALTSRFHRFFLKNLDTNDVNVRIVRMGTTVGIKQPVVPKPHINYATSQFTLENAISFPTSPAAFGHSTPTQYKSLVPTVSPLIGDIALKPSYVDNYFSSIKQPYRYEQVGIINKAIKNPFTALNTGENLAKSRLSLSQYPTRQHTTSSILAYTRPLDVDPRTRYDILSDGSYLTNTNYHDFNGLRHAKSIGFNSTVRH